jgi:hypothetical protein
MLKRAAWTILPVAWVALVGFGLYVSFAYETTPSRAAASPTVWPAGTVIARNEHGATLVLFAHPACPCTRASLSELAEIARAVPATARIEIVFVLAGSLADRSGELASEIPGAVVTIDTGTEAARFGVATSGTVVVYDRDGRLQFSGGITGSRGHVGDNIGRRDATAALAGRIPEHHIHAAFGCALVGGPA